MIQQHNNTTQSNNAILYIREQKIKVLVQSVSNALNAVLLEAPSAGGPAGDALAMVRTHPKSVHATCHCIVVVILDDSLC
jgi:hypothetical protein